MKAPGKNLLRLTVIALIAVVIAGMWFIKNRDNSSPESAPVAVSESVLEEPLELTNTLDLESYLGSGIPVIIDFGADSCVPCKEMAPVLEALHTELKGKAIIRFVDVWKNQQLADGFPLRVIPTQVLFDASGKPYAPPENSTLKFTMYKSRETDEHMFTTHEGGLTRDQLLTILSDMGM